MLLFCRRDVCQCGSSSLLRLDVGWSQLQSEEVDTEWKKFSRSLHLPRCGRRRFDSSRFRFQIQESFCRGSCLAKSVEKTGLVTHPGLNLQPVQRCWLARRPRVVQLDHCGCRQRKWKVPVQRSVEGLSTSRSGRGIQGR